MSSLWQDVRYSIRAIRKSPAFSLVVIVTLALGIGANGAIFSVVDAVLLRAYPYPDMERIVLLNERTRRGEDLSVSWLNFQDWAAQNQVFEHLGLYRGGIFNLTGGEQPERLTAATASSGMFGAMGIAPLMGRRLAPEDDRAGAERVAVISERLWRMRFNRDPAILGRALLLNGEPHTVVGVMPATMRFPSRLTDVWLPLGPIVDTLPKDRGAHPGLYAVGLMKADVTFDTAVAEMDRVARRLEQEHPTSNHGLGVAMIPYHEAIVGQIRPTLLILLAAVGFVLLIACANLTNLMLARSERRLREIAVRRALGADRWRIAQQLLLESVMLALIGGALGVVLAFWLVKFYVGSQPTTVPRIDMVAVDVRVIGFAALLSIATGVLFGLAPALRASGTDLRGALNQAARGSLLAPSRRLRSTLVVVQVAMALALLVGAGLMIRSFSKLVLIDPGFNPENVLTMRMTLPPSKYAAVAAWQTFHLEFDRRIAAIPGVVSSGLNSAVPLQGGGSESPVIAEGDPMPTGENPPTITLFHASTAGYFRAMGIPLLQGRYFGDQDAASGARVAIVDDTLVRKLFSGEYPIGKRIAFEFDGHGPDGKPLWREIVGVVGHVRHYGLASEPPYVQVYAPLAQLPFWMERRRPAMAMFVRTTIAPDKLVSTMRREVAAIDRDIPLYSVQTMSRYLQQETEQPRTGMMMLGGLGALALILAMIGIYGVVSYSVAQRTQEIGVRMTMGATRSDVLKLIVGQAMALVALGVIVGVCGAIAGSSTIKALLYQVSERDPSTMGLAAAVLLAVGFLASFVPAFRATRVDPLVALRDT
jgi:putative ABC transport system permease protein